MAADSTGRRAAKEAQVTIASPEVRSPGFSRTIAPIRRDARPPEGGTPNLTGRAPFAIFAPTAQVNLSSRKVFLLAQKNPADIPSSCSPAATPRNAQT